MSKKIDYQKLEYLLVTPDNTDQLKGVIPEELRYQLQKGRHTFCMVACDDVCAYGLCVFFCFDKAVFIKHIDVRRDAMGQGIGRAVLGASLLFAKEQGAEAAQVLLADTKTDLIAFFKACDFQKYGYQTDHYFRLKALEESKFIQAIEANRKAKQEKNHNLQEESSLDTAFAENKILHLDQVAVPEIMKFAKTLDQEDRFHDFLNPHVERRCSLVYMEKGQIIGCILIGRYDDLLTIEYAETEAIANPKTFVEMVYEAYQTARKLYPEDSPVYAMTIDRHAENILNKLVPKQDKQIRRYKYELLLDETESG